MSSSNTYPAIDRQLPLWRRELELLLNGHAGPFPALEQWLQGNPDDPQVASTMLLHRLLLEDAASRGAPARRRQLRGQLRGERRSRRGIVWYSSGVLAVAAGLLLLLRLMSVPLSPEVEDQYVSDDVAMPSWLQLEHTPDTRFHLRGNDQGYEIHLEYGRLAVLSASDRGTVPLALVVGEHRASLLGTSLDLRWDGSQGVLAVSEGVVQIQDLRVGAGEEVYLWELYSLPPLHSLPGSVWQVGNAMPAYPAAIFIPVSQEHLQSAHGRLLDDEESPIKRSLQGTRTMPDALAGEQAGQPDAVISLPALAAGPWAFDILCNNGGFQLQSAAKFVTGLTEVHASATHAAGQWRWLPADLGQLQALHHDGSEHMDLRLFVFEPDLSLSGVLLRPLPEGALP